MNPRSHPLPRGARVARGLVVLLAIWAGCGGATNPPGPSGANKPPAKATPAGTGSRVAAGSTTKDPVLAALAHGGAERLAARLPPIRRLVALGDTRGALAALDALERDLPGPTAATLGLRGRAHQQAGDLDLAAKAYTRAIAASPDDLAARGGLAETLLRQGREREALPHLERYAALTPDAVERAKAQRTMDELRARGEPAGSATAGSESNSPESGVIDELVRHAPELAKGSAVHAHLRDALVLLDAKRYDEARAELDHAIELAPADARAYALRGRAHRLAGRLESASVDAERAIALAPRDGFAYVERGLVALARKAYPAAISAFGEAGERETDPVAKARLAEWCEQLRAATSR